MTYQEALDYIASLEPRGWRLGLDRMREFAHQAGLDDAIGAETPQFIHVAGTNGKGSVTAFLQSILHESGYRVGAFYSPYVYDPRERIQLGRELIPEGIVAGLTAMLKPLAEEFTETEFGGISEFEFKTALALMFFKRLKCDWVALEVGIGGRLDATNIISPRCSVIVSIGLDHTTILGDTLEKIAYEKAGIIKPGVPVVIGQMPNEAVEVIEREAADKGCQVWRYGREITVVADGSDHSVATPHGEHRGLKVGIQGAKQAHNMALAVAACDVAGATKTLGGLQRGAAKARIPGRFEIRRVEGKAVLLDGAHNTDAAQALIETILSSLSFKRLLLVTGMIAGHEPASFYRAFAGFVDEAYAVPIQFHRALDPTEVASAIKQFMPDVKTCASAGEGFQAALDSASDDDLILVTGSFYLVGEVGRQIAGIESEL